MYLDFYDISAWDGCLSLVFIWRFIYYFLNDCPLIARRLREVGRFGPWTLG